MSIHISGLEEKCLCGRKKSICADDCFVLVQQFNEQQNQGNILLQSPLYKKFESYF